PRLRGSRIGPPPPVPPIRPTPPRSLGTTVYEAHSIGSPAQDEIMCTSCPRSTKCVIHPRAIWICPSATKQSLMPSAPSCLGPLHIHFENIDLAGICYFENGLEVCDLHFV